MKKVYMYKTQSVYKGKTVSIWLEYKTVCSHNIEQSHVNVHDAED